MANAPSLMFEHGLDPKKGWFQMHALDYQAKLSDNVTFDLPAGRTCHINSVGEYETGVGASGATSCRMPIYLFSGSVDFDVQNPGTTASGLFMHQAVGPEGNMLGLVATGGYQLETTEFIAEADSTLGAYAPNQPLTAATANTTLATGGMITNTGTGSGNKVQQFVNPICGIVAKGVLTNAHGVSVLNFWSYFLPGAFA